jgi:hypothetical protein
MYDPKKWKSIGFLSKKGKTNKTPVIDERDGTQAGYHVEHWDDRKDAVAQPKPVDLSLKVNGDE